MIFHEMPADFKLKFEVVSCFVEVAGYFLLLYRQDHKPQGNTWCLPAGKHKDSEEPVAALLRELFEETGYQALMTDLEPVAKVFVRYPEYDFSYEMFRLKLDHRFDVVLNLDEHKDFRWVTVREALSMVLIPDEDACIKLAYGLK